MQTEQPTTVFEYLRPEGVMEKVDYYLPPDYTKIAAELAEKDIHCCVEIMPEGFCSVYLYDSTNQIGSHRLRGQHHACADVALRAMLRSYNV